MAPMTSASTRSPRKNDAAVVIASSSTSGERTCRTRVVAHRARCDRTAFGPATARLCPTSQLVSPAPDVRNAASTTDAESAAAASIVIGSAATPGCAEVAITGDSTSLVPSQPCTGTLRPAETNVRGPVRSALRMADSEQPRCRVVDGEALKELGRRLHCPSCTQGYVDATCLKDRDDGVSTATTVHVPRRSEVSGSGGD